jgi:hypothetical protein
LLSRREWERIRKSRFDQHGVETERHHITEIEIHATPDRFFRAITEAEQIVRWFAPVAKVEPGVSGTYFVSWGPGMEGTSQITPASAKAMDGTTSSKQPSSAGRVSCAV